MADGSYITPKPGFCEPVLRPSRRARAKAATTQPGVKLRQDLEAAVEEALALLDALDGDPDLEPSLAQLGSRRWPGAPPAELDLEEEHDGREPGEDEEPPLGWSEGSGWQGGSRTRAGSLGYGSDELEPSLGSLGVMDQRRWAEGDQQAAAWECEAVSEDEGGACEDEGADADKEPDNEHELCNWQDEGDQTSLRHLPMIPPPHRPSPHANVGPFVAVAVLPPGPGVYVFGEVR
jgi:hypothetical protein